MMAKRMVDSSQAQDQYCFGCRSSMNLPDALMIVP